MRWLPVVVILLAGCTSPPSETTEGPADPDLHARTAPSQTGMYMHDCEQTVLIFHVDLATLQTHLPEGYEAIPAEEQYAQLGLPAIPAIADKGWFFIEAHGCADAEGGMVHADLNQQIAIRHAARDEGMPFATVLAYELDRGGDSHFSSFWAAHGKTPFADDVSFSLTDEGAYRTATAEARSGGTTKISFEVPAIPENPLELDDAYGRTWTETDNGTIMLGWDAGEHAGEPVNAYVGGPPPTCTLAADTAAARILGATTCAEAIQGGNPILPLSPEIHDMDTTWTFTPT